MGLIGLLYILFEKSILSSPKGSSPNPPTFNSISSAVLGVQTGLILLAMFVTKSSVTSIQSKRGLPLGNQVVGWIVLGT
jgi:phosphatidylinositol glycan class N